MLVVTTVTLLGLLGGVAASQLGGLRLGGVVIVPLLAVYTLRSFGTFPVLLMSVVGSYLSLRVVSRRLLLYGRPLFIVAVLTGGLVPLFVYVFATLGAGPRAVVSELGFIGSVLPGIAAFNIHRLPRDRRVVDALWSVALLIFLVVVGIGLVVGVGLTPLATVTPPVLLAPESDIARAFGLVVEGSAHPAALPFPRELGTVGLGFLLSEVARSRWGLRTGGLVVLPVLVLFGFRNAWLLPVLLLAATLAYLGIQLLHSWTLIYGRALLSVSVIFGLLTVVSVVPALPFGNGLLPFFTGIFGGVGAYKLHVVAPAERRPALVVAGGVFVLLAGSARLLLTPLPGGLLEQVAPAHIAAGVVVLALAAREGSRLEAVRPSGDSRHSTPEVAERVHPEVPLL